MQHVAVPILKGEPCLSKAFIGLALDGVEARDVPWELFMKPDSRTLLWLYDCFLNGFIEVWEFGSEVGAALRNILWVLAVLCEDVSD